MEVSIQSVPLRRIRNAQAGDWRITPRGFDIFVAKMKDIDMQLLLALHELIEARLCQKHGITDEVVTAFDRDFQGEGEPGEAPGAPYRAQHLAALEIEKHVAIVLGVDWRAYERKLDELFK